MLRSGCLGLTKESGLGPGLEGRLRSPIQLQRSACGKCCEGRTCLGTGGSSWGRRSSLLRSNRARWLRGSGTLRLHLDSLDGLETKLHLRSHRRTGSGSDRSGAAGRQASGQRSGRGWNRSDRARLNARSEGPGLRWRGTGLSVEDGERNRSGPRLLDKSGLSGRSGLSRLGLSSKGEEGTGGNSSWVLWLLGSGLRAARSDGTRRSHGGERLEKEASRWTGRSWHGSSCSGDRCSGSWSSRGSARNWCGGSGGSGGYWSREGEGLKG